MPSSSRKLLLVAAGRAHRRRVPRVVLALIVLLWYGLAVALNAQGAIERNLACIDRRIDRMPLFNWGSFRWFEGLLALYWLYERHPAVAKFRKDQIERDKEQFKQYLLRQYSKPGDSEPNEA